MTRIEQRLIRLEAGLDPRPDERAREVALGEATRRITKAVAWLKSGGAPSCAMEHALARNNLDVVAAIEELLEMRRAAE